MSSAKTSAKPIDSKKDKKSDLGALEEDDDFEEFPAEGVYNFISICKKAVPLFLLKQSAIQADVEVSSSVVTCSSLAWNDIEKLV